MVVCYGVEDDIHMTQQCKIVSLWEELVKNSENTLEQIAVEGVGPENTCTLSNCSNVFSTNSLVLFIIECNKLNN